jgi:hypothetical protein
MPDRARQLTVGPLGVPTSAATGAARKLAARWRIGEAETRLRHERVRAVVGNEVRVQFTLDSSADEILDRQAAALDQKLTIPCNERGAPSGG